MRFNWRKFFSDYHGTRFSSGHGEEQRYQAFKARFLEEQRWVKEEAAKADEKVHDKAMEAAYGPYGQG